jgi:hypothetical protein
MTAQSAERARSVERWTYRQFTLAATHKAWKGASASLVLSGADAGRVVPSRTTLVIDQMVIGTFSETVDATSAAKSVNVDFGREIEMEWLANSGTNVVSASNVGSLAYYEDDQTVGTLSTGYPRAGRVWSVDATRGVLVQRLRDVTDRLAGLTSQVVASAAFVANDLVVPNNPTSGTVYTVPATGAASTVTLPAAARTGTRLTFVANGTLNGHTVQYRDATGPTNLTTALTAAKRHSVVCDFDGTNWYAAAYVSP